MRTAIVLACLMLLVSMGCAVPPGGGQTAADSIFSTESRIMADIMKHGFPDTAMLRYREGYVVSYDVRNRVPVWVAERLNEKRLERKVPRSERSFQIDESIPEAARSTSADYADSGYIRGRMAAASNHRTSELAVQQTYYLSNVAPMLGDDFRMSYWVHLEKKIRAWARESNDLFVYTGPIYAATDSEGKRAVRYEVIGENRVAVPTHFFKVMLRERGRTKEMLALVIPHEPITAETPLSSFVTSVDHVESLTGLDFFPEMSEPTQGKLEAAKPGGVWEE